MRIKKLTAAAMTGVMVLGMGTNVYAAGDVSGTITDANGTATHDVQAKYATDEEAATKYSVDIKWGALEYTYTIATEGRWNPETHQYDDKSNEGTWSCDEDADKIKVTNHSNTAVTAEFAYEQGQDYDSVTGAFDNARADLATAEGTIPTEAPTATATLGLSGTLNKDVKTATTVGTVTVSLATQ